MQTTNAMMINMINNTDIKLYGDVVSKEALIKNFIDFVAATSETEGHKVGIIMHTGSVCFEVIALTYAAILCLIKNETNMSDVIQSLSIGEMVLYGSKKKERYFFKGLVTGKEINITNAEAQYMKLEKTSGETRYVPEKSWRLVEPYRGTSTRTDGRGIRKGSTVRDDFFTDVLGVAISDIPAIIDASCVIGISREKADWLLKGISISFSEKEIKLLELVTASYFTEEDEYRYGGNTSKNEAVVKITSKLSVARSLLYSRNGNSHIGLFVLDREIIERGMSELPELMNRKSLECLYLCVPVDADLADVLLNQYEDAEVFACTKDYLNDYVETGVAEHNRYTDQLAIQSAVIRTRKNIFEVIEKAPITGEEYEKIRKGILQIKRSDYGANDKDSFIIQAYSLLKLLLTVPLPISQINNAIENGIISVEDPFQKIQKIEQIAYSFPVSLAEKAIQIVSMLESAYKNISVINEKGEWIKNYLIENCDKKIAIIVPKAYYVPLIEEYILYSAKMKKMVTVHSVGRFDSAVLCDAVIVVGDFEGKSFNAFQCNAAYSVISLLYGAEEKKVVFRKRMSEKKINRLYKKSIHAEIETENICDEDTHEELQEDNELADYIASCDAIYSPFIGSSTENSGKHSTGAEVVAIAVFSDDTRAFLSKRYKGYVLNEVSGVVKECSAIDLREGDSLIFTKNNNDTKDIVDSILLQLIAENRISIELSTAYEKSKRWKKALACYMTDNGLSEREVAAKMIDRGISVQEATVLIWLDEDAHTVGPRKIESIIAIAEFVGDNELKNDAENVFQACREVRSVRRRILEQVGKAIINGLAGRQVTGYNEFSVISERVETMADIKQIDRITFINQWIPNNLVNRALTV